MEANTTRLRFAAALLLVATLPVAAEYLVLGGGGAAEFPGAVRVAAGSVVLLFLPGVFWIVGFGMLFLRPADRNVWLLSLIFCCVAVLPDPGLVAPEAVPRLLRAYTATYRMLAGDLAPAAFCFLFFRFPARSTLDRAAPWLKWGLLWTGVAMVATNRWPPPATLEEMAAYGGTWLTGLLATARELIEFPLTMGVPLGLLALVLHTVQAPSSEVRRKARVLAAGAVFGMGPFLLLLFWAGFVGLPAFWLWGVAMLFLPIMPAAFVYTIVRHRVLDLPVLLRRSVRYVLVVRGLVVVSILASVAITIVLVRLVGRFLPMATELGTPAAVLLAALAGVGVARAGADVERRVTGRIDRAFFRDRYDARQVLESLVDRVRAAHGRDELATMLETEVRTALHPASLALWLASREGQLEGQGGGDGEPATLDPDAGALSYLAGRGQPLIVPPAGASGEARPVARLRALLQPLDVECVTPLVDQNERLVGLIALGPRLSDEPYSGEDRRLLAVAADRAALTMQALMLGEAMAERLEAERRAEREIAMAQEVQHQLLPAEAPRMPGLECAGHCSQARSVGGDYYDFIPTGPDGLMLVLGDVSGKGISAALLTSNLQATLRAQYAATGDDPVRLLERVHELFFASTPGNRYATLFLGSYHQSTGELRYVNCGHIPPLVVRADGAVETLEVTATPIGLFEQWVGASAATTLRPGDTLVICSDGIPEAMNDADELFGDDRLEATLRANARLPVPDLIDAIQRAVQQFAGTRQSDDLTLLVARATA